MICIVAYISVTILYMIIFVFFCSGKILYCQISCCFFCCFFIDFYLVNGFSIADFPPAPTRPYISICTGARVISYNNYWF